MSKVKSVLFVCTGNSCRSVMAEGLLKKYLKELGKSDILVTSAGIRGIDGMSPTEETIKVLGAEDVRADDDRSKTITDKMIKEAGLILVMEEMHKKEVLSKVPEAAGKTFLLKEYMNAGAKGDEEGTGIPDPIGRPIEFYRYVLKIIKRETGRIARLL